MELTTITFKKANIEVDMEKNSGGSYSISARSEKLPDEPYEKPFISFRTDEFEIDDIIEILKFCKDYDFIQGEKK